MLQSNPGWQHCHCTVTEDVELADAAKAAHNAVLVAAHGKSALTSPAAASDHVETHTQLQTQASVLESFGSSAAAGMTVVNTPEVAKFADSPAVAVGDAFGMGPGWKQPCSGTPPAVAAGVDGKPEVEVLEQRPAQVCVRRIVAAVEEVVARAEFRTSAFVVALGSDMDMAEVQTSTPLVAEH